MKLNTYLTFDDECRAAFEYYRGVFGGDFLVIQTFGDGPDDMGVPDAEKDKIMHVTLPIGESMLMGSDTVSGFSDAPNMGNNFSISIAPDSREEADRIYAALSDGGTAKMPMDDMFWGSYFGACTDKFGINWMINLDTQGA